MGAEEQICRILQLSDCTMMYILSYLDATSLFNLSRTCEYFRNIVQDPALWCYIDGRHLPNSTKKVQYVCGRVHEKTSHVLMRAESKYDGLVPQNSLMEWNKLQNITVLALENQRFDGRTLTLQKFPRTLEELSLRKTYIKNGKLFFQSSFGAMCNLRVLILDECDWLDSNFFMSVAKYEHLEILSIVKCMRLHLNVIPYLNVARRGCKKLKVIDCRFNTVGNEILVHSHKSLLAMYFQSMSSYQLDTGKALVKHPPLTKECQDLISQSTIKNRSLEQYKYIIGDIIEELPKSLLYQDPYPDCTCGWKDKENAKIEEFQEGLRSMPIDDYIDFNLSPHRFICRRHMKELNGLPKDFKNFFYQNQKKFHPDSSDNDSDSDDDKDCCMFGVGKSQQMIVLKVREADEHGNLPEPEIIDVFAPSGRVINIDVNVNCEREGQPPRNEEPQPSTSRASHSAESSSRSSTKRKAKDSGQGERKRLRREENTESDRNSPSPSVRIINLTSPSSSNADNNRMQLNEDINSPGPSRQTANAQNTADPNGDSPNQEHLVPVITVGPARLINEQQNGGVPGLVRRRLRSLIEGLGVPIRGPQLGVAPQEKIKLRRLSLRGYREISDAALICIRNLSLDLLDVTHTRVTKEGIEKFLTFNPNCRIIHPNYCVCKPRLPC